MGENLETLPLPKESIGGSGSGYIELNLMNLPNEILDHIGTFLEPQNLLSLSATCHRLRDIYNVNSVWSRYTHGGVVGEKLKAVKNVVKPVFSIPESENLKPLCQQREHFARQTRLIENLKKKKVKIFDSGIQVDFRDRYESLLSERRLTYNNKYLFARYPGCRHVLVIDIEDEPCFYTRVPTITQNIKWVQVVDNMLLVCQTDEAFVTTIEFQEIRLPDKEFPTLFSIPHGNYFDVKVVVATDVLLTHNFRNNSNITVWNIRDGAKCGEIVQKCESPKVNLFNVLSYSESSESILIFNQITPLVDPSFNPVELNLLVYSLKSGQFTFSVSIPATDFTYFDGTLSDHHAVIIFVLVNQCKIFVFDTKTSAQVSQVEVNLPRFKSLGIIGCVQIIKSSLVFAETSSILILNTGDLKFEWKIATHNAHSFWGVDYLPLSSLRHFLGVKTHDGEKYEIWDFESRTKLFDFQFCFFSGFSDSYSQLFVSDSQELTVLKLW